MAPPRVGKGGTGRRSPYVSSGMNAKLTPVGLAAASVLALSSCSTARDVNDAGWQPPALAPIEGREIDLGLLAQRASALEAQGVNGAAELHGLIVQAQAAR